MDSIIRIASVSSRVVFGNPLATAQNMACLLEGIKKHQADIYLFPSCALSGKDLGAAAYQKNFIYRCEEGISYLREVTKKLNAYVIVGSLLFDNGKPTEAFYVLHKGEVTAILTEKDYDYVFSVRHIKFNVLSQPLSRLPLWAEKQALLGTDLTLIPLCEPAKAGSANQAFAALSEFSKACAGAVCCANGGVGGTSFPYLYRGFAGTFECGKAVAYKTSLQGDLFTVADIDCDIVRASKEKAGMPMYSDDFCHMIDTPPHTGLMRIIPKDPYLPQRKEERDAYLLDLFQLQGASLAVRMKNTGINQLVIGVSGGLDSTLALLACVNAVDSLNLSRDQILAVTMPGFGTSGTTYDSAIALIQSLGCAFLEVPIKDSVLLHFRDIRHDPNLRDTTYENAQARERTQILLDIANQRNALVVGTGDLSEAALGFCTFAGDHISNFNVNACVTKTMIRQMIVTLLGSNEFATSRQVLTAILNTPVSPELLPPGENGAIAQKTEDILGPYLLHDFFLYHFCRYHFTPTKIYHYAVAAFQDERKPEYIKQKLILFFRRFCSAQFKRSCSPDSAILTEVNLSVQEFTMPSDLNADLFIRELNEL